MGIATNNKVKAQKGRGRGHGHRCRTNDRVGFFFNITILFACIFNNNKRWLKTSTIH